MNERQGTKIKCKHENSFVLINVNSRYCGSRKIATHNNHTIRKFLQKKIRKYSMIFIVFGFYFLQFHKFNAARCSEISRFWFKYKLKKVAEIYYSKLLPPNSSKADFPFSSLEKRQTLVINHAQSQSIRRMTIWVYYFTFMFALIFFSLSGIRQKYFEKVFFCSFAVLCIAAMMMLN